MAVACIITYILSILDLIFTRTIVNKLGLEVEGNPFGKMLLKKPFAAYFYKIVVVGICLLLIYHFQEYVIATVGICILCGAFVLLTIYHSIVLIKMYSILY